MTEAERGGVRAREDCFAANGCLVYVMQVPVQLCSCWRRLIKESLAQETVQAWASSVMSALEASLPSYLRAPEMFTPSHKWGGH